MERHLLLYISRSREIGSGRHENARRFSWLETMLGGGGGKEGSFFQPELLLGAGASIRSVVYLRPGKKKVLEISHLNFITFELPLDFGATVRRHTVAPKSGGDGTPKDKLFAGRILSAAPWSCFETDVNSACRSVCSSIRWGLCFVHARRALPLSLSTPQLQIDEGHRCVLLPRIFEPLRTLRLVYVAIRVVWVYTNSYRASESVGPLLRTRTRGVDLTLSKRMCSNQS